MVLRLDDLLLRPPSSRCLPLPLRTSLGPGCSGKIVLHRVRSSSKLRTCKSFTAATEAVAASVAGERRVVLYFTSLRAVRPTIEACRDVRAILRGLRVGVDERDVRALHESGELRRVVAGAPQLPPTPCSSCGGSRFSPYAPASCSPHGPAGSVARGPDCFLIFLFRDFCVKFWISL